MDITGEDIQQIMLLVGTIVVEKTVLERVIRTLQIELEELKANSTEEMENGKRAFEELAEVI